MVEKLPQKTEKPWGQELLFAHTKKYAGAVIFVRKGHRFSLHYHEKLDETLYVYQGRAVMEMEDSQGNQTEVEATGGSCCRIRPQTKHRLRAIEDTVIFRVSTPEIEDTVRLVDDYGRV